ncbi:MAG: hypothetical protein A3H50_01400 [Candidatus Levybacteria bacterium RIFCSPLOWO2_02_FULL_37_10]|nr:MAG: hypothetical protein A3H50_01400 [Candidatus Levybacteria bacterium RIFCSPLOWO2_02_FULL_37_10]
MRLKFQPSGKLITIIIILALISLWFYWFQWFPAKIRSDCENEIITSDTVALKYLDEDTRPKSVEDYNLRFMRCIHRSALK